MPSTTPTTTSPSCEPSPLPMIRLDAATVLLQWAVGGLFFCWVTTRRREVSLGYGWLLRGTYGLIALGALVTGLRYGEPVPVRDVASAGVVLGTLVALVVSVVRRKAGVAGERERVEASSARVAAMTGIERQREARDTEAPEFPPAPRPDRPRHRARRSDRGRRGRRRPRPPVRRPRDRRGGVPRGRHRRDAPGPLVPGAARHAARSAAGAHPLAGLDLALRGHRAAVAGRHGLRDHRHHRRRVQRHPRLDVDPVRAVHDRAGRRHPRRPRASGSTARSWPPPGCSTWPSSRPSARTSSPAPSSPDRAKRARSSQGRSRRGRPAERCGRAHPSRARPVGAGPTSCASAPWSVHQRTPLAGDRRSSRRRALALA